MSKRKCPGPAIAGVVLLACAGVGRTQTLDQKINNAWTFAASQVLATAGLSSLNAGGGDVLYPTVTTGYSTWQTDSSTDGWQAGFFPGQLWLLYGHSGNATFQTDAEKWTNPFQYSLNGSDPDKGIILDEDAGFDTVCSWGNGLIYSSDAAYSGSAAVNTIVNNASYLNSRFLPEANGTGMIRSLGVPGNYSTVVWPTYAGFSNSHIQSLHINDASVIDHSMGLQTLFEAHALQPNATTDVYYQNAITDAVTSAHQFVRNDGSSYHAVWYYDPTAPANLAGTVWGKGTEQGYANESTWSRGQAWGNYAFAEDYFYTRNDPTQAGNGNVSLFLNTAQNMANYFWNNLPANLPHTSADYVAGDYVPPVDFNADSGEQNTTTDQQGRTYYDAAGTGNFNQSVSGTSSSKGSYVNDRFVGLGTYTERDTAAAAIEASAMLQLAQYEPNHTLGLQYFNEAGSILGSLLTESSTSGTGKTDYFAENTSGHALGVGLLLQYSLQWTKNSNYASASYGDYYVLQAMTDYQALEGQWSNNLFWSSSVAGNWGDTTKWSPTSAPTMSLGANFSTGSSTPYTVTLASNSSAASVTVQDNLTIQKSGFNLTVPGVLSITGTAALPASLTLAGGGVTTVGSLSINSFGKLDITNNAVVIAYSGADPEGTIRNYIKTGYDGGKWDSIGGITSSTANNDAVNGGAPYFGNAAIGYADNSFLGRSDIPNNSVMVRFTFYGDSDLNGVVNLSDFSDFLGGLHDPTDNPANWFDGDYDYSGSVNLSDFSLFLGSFHGSQGSLGNLVHAVEVSALSPSQQQELLSMIAAVPEPASMGLIGFASLGLLARRKRARLTKTN